MWVAKKTGLDAVYGGPFSRLGDFLWRAEKATGLKPEAIWIYDYDVVPFTMTTSIAVSSAQRPIIWEDTTTIERDTTIPRRGGSSARIPSD